MSKLFLFSWEDNRRIFVSSGGCIGCWNSFWFQGRIIGGFSFHLVGESDVGIVSGFRRG